MDSRTTLLAEIEAFLTRTGMSPTRFGIEAIGDRALLQRLREGRDPKTVTVDKLRAYMRRMQRNPKKKQKPLGDRRAAA